MTAHPRRLLTGLIAVLVALTATDAFAERVRCGSRDYRYAFCSTPGRVVSVRIARRYSKRPCLQNYTWGWERDGIWVDDGCDADFDVVMRGAGGPGGSRPVPGPPPYAGPPAAIEPAPWAIGEWRTEGYRLTIYRGGSIVLAYGRSYDRGYMSGSEVVLRDGTQLVANRDRRGLSLAWPIGRRLYFTRVRSFSY